MDGSDIIAAIGMPGHAHGAVIRDILYRHSRRYSDAIVSAGFRTRHHRAAGLSALLARVGAGLAVIVFVLAAFGGAGFADPGAQCADIARESAATRHDTGREAAHVSTIHVEFDAVFHHGDIAFVQTRGGAMFAGGGARKAFLDAGLQGIGLHIGSLATGGAQ